MFQPVLENAEEPEIKMPTSAGLLKKQESSRKTSISSFLTMPKPLTLDHNKLWKILKEMGIPDHLTCLLRNLYTGQATSSLGEVITERTCRSTGLNVYFVKVDVRVHMKKSGRSS